MNKILITTLYLTVFSTLWGQTNSSRRCGTTEYYQKKLGKAGYEAFKQRLNSWISEGIVQRRTRRTVGSTTSIAVVVHILHRGESVGRGTNLSAAQVRSQIIVLNQDFNRLNPDSVNTPSVFQPVAASIGIHFALATINPQNKVMAEPGINRIRVSKRSYTEQEIDKLRIEHTWETDKYLNIFVVTIEGDDGGEILGYANLPDNSTLSGISSTGNSNKFLDGIVIKPRSFGSNYTKEGSAFDLESFTDRGRTTTHEVGHYLGLLHIWGDGGCNVDDFVDDTPIAGQSHSGYSRCNNIVLNTCTEFAGEKPDMFQNYMDYTADVCMNLFTKGQKERMLTVIEKADRRRNLNFYYDQVTASTPIDPTALPLPTPASAEDLTFYPNPTTGQFKIEIDNERTGNYEFQIFNSFGKVVFKDNFIKQVKNYTYTGNVSHLPNGIYILVLQNKNYHHRLKFILAK